MANAEHLGSLKADVDKWNLWREDNREVIPDLSGADLARADLRMANLNSANLTNANLVMANLAGADLRDGCKGSSGGGDHAAVYVYAYAITANTKE